MFEETSPQRGQPHSASIPGEEFGFKLDLQGTDLATQGGLRDIEEVRSLPDTIEFRSLHEITELLDFHGMIPRCENGERPGSHILCPSAANASTAITRTGS